MMLDLAVVARQPLDDLRHLDVDSWVALTEPGWPILVSLDRLDQGYDPADIVQHESTHEHLLVGTQFGRLLVQVAAFARDPPAPHIDQRRACRLLAIGLQACFVTQEGCATMSPLLTVRDPERSDYWQRLPDSYRQAARHLWWLHASPLTRDEKHRLLIHIGWFALANQALDDWFTHELWSAANWRAYLSDPRRHPDARFTTICGLLAQRGPEDLRGLAASNDLIADLSRISGAPVAYFVPPANWSEWIQALAILIGHKLGTETSAEIDEVDPVIIGEWASRRIDEPGEFSPARCVLTQGSSSHVCLTFEHPSVQDLVNYRLVRLTVNTSGGPVAGSPWRDEDTAAPLPPNGAYFEAFTPSGATRLAQLSPSMVQSYLEAIDDDVTLVVPLRTYDLGSGDVRGDASVQHRPHIVATGHVPPDRFVRDLMSGGLAGEREVTWGLTGSIHTGAVYLVIRPAAKPYPIVVCPVLQIVLPLVVGALEDKEQSTHAYPATHWRSFFADGRRGLAHATRWINTFDADSWHPRYFAGGTSTPKVWLPDDPSEVASLGRSLEQGGADAAAARLYTLAIESRGIDYACVGAIQFGLLYLRLHLYELAIARFTASWLANDDWLASLGELYAGRAAEIGLRYDLARTQYEHAIATYSGEHAVAAEVGLADCAAVVGDYGVAIRTYDRVIGYRVPLHSVSAAIQKGKLLRQSGAPEEGDALLDEIVQSLSNPADIVRVRSLVRDCHRVADAWWRDHLEEVYGEERADEIRQFAYSAPLRRY